jgi:hypothetical protein
MKYELHDAVIVRNVCTVNTQAWQGWRRYDNLAFVVRKFHTRHHDRGSMMNWYVVILDDGTLARCVSGDMKKV